MTDHQWAQRHEHRDLQWDPPAGGTWEHESVHTHGPMWLAFQDLFPEAMRQGSAEMFRRYGVPLERLDVRFVNNFCFVRVVPVGAPEPKVGKASPVPPPAVLKVMSRLHPELRRRRRSARAALLTKRWRGDAAGWYEHTGPRRAAANRALVGENVDAMDGPQLADHLERVAAGFVTGAQEHFHLTIVHDVAVGRLVDLCSQHGIDVNDVLTLLAGYSPASAETTTAITAIAGACQRAGVRPATLDDIRSASPEAAAALDAYLADHGWRMLTGYGPDDLALIEVPNVVVGSVVAAIDGIAPTPASAGGETTGRGDGSDRTERDGRVVRDRLPSDQQSRFDELLAEARHVYGIRDANVGLTFQWPVGLLRRALLAAGRRLVADGALDEIDEIGLLHLSEITGMLRSDVKVDADELDARRARWAAGVATDPPAYLGEAPAPPPDPSVFPKEVAEVTRATLATLDIPRRTPDDGLSTAERADAGDCVVLHGDGIGTGTVTGRACVAADAAEALARVDPGDILVTPFTTPAYNAVLPLLRGLVVEHAGPFSHAAIVAREFGLPAILGVDGATALLAEGTTVVLDASTGSVSAPRSAG